MGGADVLLTGLPLTRANPWYSGQMGVPGTDTETGLRLHPTGTTFYVDRNFPGASDQRDGTDPTSPLLTVTAAISKCQPHRGDVIMVGASSAWFYAEGGIGLPTAEYTLPIVEEVTLDVAGVRLIGASHSALGNMWTPASNGGTCLTVTAIDCIVEGFVFSEGQTYTGCNAIYCEWDGITLFGENLTVRNCAFDDTVDIAIQLEFSWYCVIHNNVFSQCDTCGIYLDPAGSAAAYLDIYNNFFNDCAVAMAMTGLDNSQIYNNRIYNSNAQAVAVATNEGLFTTGGSSNMVANNWFSCALPAGANGDWDDLNTAAATDAWVGNHCMNGLAVTNPT